MGWNALNKGPNNLKHETGYLLRLPLRHPSKVDVETQHVETQNLHIYIMTYVISHKSIRR